MKKKKKNFLTRANIMLAWLFNAWKNIGLKVWFMRKTSSLLEWLLSFFSLLRRQLLRTNPSFVQLYFRFPLHFLLHQGSISHPCIVNRIARTSLELLFFYSVVARNIHWTGHPHSWRTCAWNRLICWTVTAWFISQPLSCVLWLNNWTSLSTNCLLYFRSQHFFPLEFLLILNKDIFATKEHTLNHRTYIATSSIMLNDPQIGRLQ